MKSIALLLTLLFLSGMRMFSQSEPQPFKPFHPPISYAVATKRADALVAKMSIDEKIELINGYNSFYVHGFPKYNIPQFSMSDATEGVHIRKKVSGGMEKSTAFPCPIALSATWDPGLAYKYAQSIGEECRVAGIAVLLGPGINIYRMSQDGRNFEYFGEDPYLTSHMVAHYVVGMESTGTITTLKHFICNNTDFHRRNSNSIVGERAMHEIYLPGFKAGVDAGAMAVMTSYNQVNGEWSGQSKYTITQLLRKDLGYKWLVMTDWWSVWDTQKIIESGQDLEMPGKVNIYHNAKKLLEEGKIKESDINRMATDIIRTFIAMGLYDRPVKDESYKTRFPEHEKIALQTAREGIVLLKNDHHVLPIDKAKVGKILLTGEFVTKLARGLGSAEVQGYDIVTMLDALKKEFGDKLEYIKKPTDAQIKSADVVLVSIGTLDSEGWDRPFALPDSTDSIVMRATSLNKNTVVIVNSGGGVRMTQWEPKVAAIIYGWYLGQNGNIALAEILSGKTNPSGKLPISIEKRFQDSPGYGYIPAGEKLYKGWGGDGFIPGKNYDIHYKEGVFVGYRWYDSKNIQPLFHFGHGLSYTTFKYGQLNVSNPSELHSKGITVEFTIKNTGSRKGAETAQLYIHSEHSKISRPVKELKGFQKVFLNAGQVTHVKLVLHPNDFAYWDVHKHGWNVEPGKYDILVGSASDDIRQKKSVTLP